MLYNLILLLPCSLCLIGAVSLILKKESNTKAQNILSLCFLLSGIFFLCTANYIVGIHDYAAYMKWDMVDSFTTLLVIPTMYLYFRSMTNEGRFTWKDYIWFVPSLVVGIGTSVLYFAMDESAVVGYIETVLIESAPTDNYTDDIYKLHRLFSVELYNITILIQLFGTGTCALIGLRRYHRRLQEFYSNMDDKYINTDKKILFWFMLTIPLAAGLIIPKRTFWEQSPVFVSIYFIAWTIVYFALFHYGIQKRYTVEDLAYDIEKSDLEAAQNKYELTYADFVKEEPNETGQINKYAQYLESFKRLIEEDRIYLKSTLRADEVAAKIRTNRTYLSRMFNEELKCTFSDYINQKRVEYAQKLMQENPAIKLIELAEESGFTSITSFGRTFKQVTGIPPKEWLKKNILKS